MKTLEYVFIYSRGQCSVHRFENFPYPFGVAVGDLKQTPNPAIK